MSSNDTSLNGLSYYRATASDWQAGPKLDGNRQCDVCVIGAGFTGLSAALELAQRGRKVIVLDSGPIAWGASGRNGGQLCTGYSPGMGKFEKQLGRELAQSCFDMSEEAKRLVVDRIKTHNINCDLKWGYLLAAPKQAHMAELEEHLDELEAYGYGGCSMLSKTELEEKLGSPVYVGGMLDPGAGHFHPLNYCIGLAQALREAGSEIFENTPATAVKDGTPAQVSTTAGTITADQVVVACNGYLDGLVNGLDQRVMPVGSYVIATEQLSQETARMLIRDDEAAADCNFVVDYFRLTADNRMLFGGRCSYSGVHPRDLAENMRPRLEYVFPRLKGVKIEYSWGGYIGITHNRLPDAGRHGKSIYYAQGYSGQGAVLAGFFGKLMAEAIAGESERLDIFSRIRHAPFPGGPLRRPALTLGMLYYRLRDLLA